MTRQPLVLVAASGLAREVMAAVARAGTHEIVGVLDDDPTRHGTAVGSVQVLGGSHLAVERRESIVVCAGSGVARAAIVARLQAAGVSSGRFATVVHPSVSIPSTCHLGIGTIVLANVSFTGYSTVGDHVAIMPNVVLTHDDVVGDYATLCAGVVLGGGVRIGRSAYVGMNASIHENVDVGPSATLGMGSALLRDLPEDQTWAGVPARPIRTSRGNLERGGRSL